MRNARLEVNEGENAGGVGERHEQVCLQIEQGLSVENDKELD